MFEVQDIEVMSCNQSKGKLYISLLFEDETHKTKFETTMEKIFCRFAS